MIIEQGGYKAIKSGRFGSKAWKDAINSMRNIPQTIHLEADPNASGGRAVYLWAEKSAFGDIKFLRAHFHAPSDDNPSVDPQPEDLIPRTVRRAHPMLEVSRNGRLRYEAAIHMTFPWTLKQMLEMLMARTMAVLEFLTQPPCTRAKLLIVDSASERPDMLFRESLEKSISCHSGIRMLDIVLGLKELAVDNTRFKTGHTYLPYVDLDRFKEVVAVVEGDAPADSN